MFYKVKIKGAGTFYPPFPSTKAAFEWAKACFPLCHPPSVICLNREVV